MFDMTQGSPLATGLNQNQPDTSSILAKMLMNQPRQPAQAGALGGMANGLQSMLPLLAMRARMGPQTLPAQRLPGPTLDPAAASMPPDANLS